MIRSMHFPTMVQQIDLSSDPDFDLIKDIIFKHPTLPHRLVSWSESSFGVNENLLDIKELQAFKNRLLAIINDYARELGLAPLKITNSWFNHLKRNQRVENHRHEMSAVSGAFYIHADTGSGRLRLHSPLAQLRMFEHVIDHTEHNSNFIDMPCKAGWLILFPSWLEHSTDLNQTDNRTTVSFNTTYQSKG